MLHCSILICRVHTFYVKETMFIENAILKFNKLDQATLALYM
jgi:hypothetical protein